MVDSLAEMVKSLKPGVRVKRGRDWNYGDMDGNSEGTITSSYTGITGVLHCKVKWDCKDQTNVNYRYSNVIEYRSVHYGALYVKN